MPLFTFAEVEERMVEAARLWRRAPDRERGWLTLRSWWPEVRIEAEVDAAGDRTYIDKDARPKPLPLTRAEVAEMNGVAEWLEVVPERDRRIVVLAIGQLASGWKRVSWTRLRRRIDAEIGTRGLGQRYSRAIAGIARALDRGELRANFGGPRG